MGSAVGEAVGGEGAVGGLFGGGFGGHCEWGRGEDLGGRGQERVNDGGRFYIEERTGEGEMARIRKGPQDGG